MRGEAPGTPAARSDGRFTDVGADDPGAAAMAWAHATGVQPALSPPAYSPHTTVTRGQAALALHRLAGAPPVDLEAVPVLLTDLGEDPGRAAALLWLHGRGALWGDAELRVHPDREVTRAEVATMLIALLRPALAAVGATWDVPAATASDPGGDQVLDRADLAVALHGANTVLEAASA